LLINSRRSSVVRGSAAEALAALQDKSGFDLSVIDVILSGTIGNSLAVAAARVEFPSASRGNAYLGHADTGCFPKTPIVEKQN
jgi:hypothetical protein